MSARTETETLSTEDLLPSGFMKKLEKLLEY